MVQIQQLKTEIGLGEEMIQLDVVSKKCSESGGDEALMWLLSH